MSYKLDEIIKMFEKSSVSKMELETGELKIKLEKNTGVSTTVQNTPNNVEVTMLNEVEGYKVLAPVVGTYYSQKASGKPPFVKKGDKVKKGDTLCIIEAMKVMNEITAPVDGTILEIYGSNESLIEYDQVLFVIEE